MTKHPAYTPSAGFASASNMFGDIQCDLFKERPEVVTVEKEKIGVVNQSNKKLTIMAQKLTVKFIICTQKHYENAIK